MLKDIMLQYVIPFECTDYEKLRYNKFEYLKNCGWEYYDSLKGECDLYHYVRELVAYHDSASGIGTSWKYKTNEKYKFYFGDFTKKDILWKIKSITLFLFDTKIGFLSYEVTVNYQKNSTLDITDKELLDFNYYIKELSYSPKNDGKIWEYFAQTYSIGEEGILSQDNGLALKLSNESGWINFADKRSDYDFLVGNTVKIKQVLKIDNKRVAVKGYKRIHLYKDVIYEYLEPIGVKTFFADRYISNEKQKVLVPDKSLLFAWIFKDEQIKDMVSDNEALMLKLARGYKDKHGLARETLLMQSEDIYQPFTDSKWYICLEGCVNLVDLYEDKEFFDAGYKNRLNCYFYLYILALNQYYGSLKYAEELAGLPGSKEEMFTSGKVELMKAYLEKVNFFSMKNMYSQVAHLTNINGYYNYMQRELHIKEIYEKLEKETRAVYQIVESEAKELEQKEKEKEMEREHTLEKKRNQTLRLFSCIGAVFVVSGVISDLNQLYINTMSEGLTIKKQVCIYGIGMIAAVIIGFIAWLIWGRWEKYNEKRSDII
uniref:hypothetical protein n=1 Tax=Agathobacter sp. TaxID=2021311 RepID=UPI0040577621